MANPAERTRTQERRLRRKRSEARMRLRIAADTRLLALHHASSPPRQFLAPPVWLIPWPAFVRRNGDCAEDVAMETSDLVNIAAQGADSGEVTSCQTLVTTDLTSTTGQPVHFDIRDQNGGIVKLRVVLTDPLAVFMDAYCIAKRVPRSRVRFMIDDGLLLPTDTGTELCLVDGDVLDAYDNEGMKTDDGWVLWA